MRLIEHESLHCRPHVREHPGLEKCLESWPKQMPVDAVCSGGVLSSMLMGRRKHQTRMSKSGGTVRWRAGQTSTTGDSSADQPVCVCVGRGRRRQSWRTVSQRSDCVYLLWQEAEAQGTAGEIIDRIIYSCRICRDSLTLLEL